MKRITSGTFFRSALWLTIALGILPNAWAGVYQHGTVVRMRMADCLSGHHPFLMTFGGQASPMIAEQCPEYTLVSDKVVFVIVGNSSGQLVPLADVVDFRIYKNEVAVRVDDAKHESKFGIREMILRSQWDMAQKHVTDELNASSSPAERSLLTRTQN